MHTPCIKEVIFDPLSKITTMCENGIVITGLREFDYDISGGFEAIGRCQYLLSMIMTGKETGW